MCGNHFEKTLFRENTDKRPTTDKMASNPSTGSSVNLSLSDSSGKKSIQGYLGVATGAPSGDTDMPIDSGNVAPAQAIEDTHVDEPLIDLGDLSNVRIHPSVLPRVPQIPRTLVPLTTQTYDIRSASGTPRSQAHSSGGASSRPRPSSAPDTRWDAALATVSVDERLAKAAADPAQRRADKRTALEDLPGQRTPSPRLS